MLGGIKTAPEFPGISYNDEATLDDKSRVLLPRKVKDALGPQFALAVGIYGGLIAIPKQIWQGIREEVRQAPILNPDRMYFSSQFLGPTATDVEVDNQGRFVIPSRLRAPANLEVKSTVFLNGADIWLEIWNPEDFAKYSENPTAFGGPRTERLLAAYDRMQSVIRNGAAA
ncbi:MAG: division/cell wall cluster transcriptional repressor MraZ [Fimbriimonas sp.]